MARTAPEDAGGRRHQRRTYWHGLNEPGSIGEEQQAKYAVWQQGTGQQSLASFVVSCHLFEVGWSTICVGAHPGGGCGCRRSPGVAIHGRGEASAGGKQAASSNWCLGPRTVVRGREYSSIDSHKQATQRTPMSSLGFTPWDLRGF